MENEGDYARRSVWLYLYTATVAITTVTCSYESLREGTERDALSCPQNCTCRPSGKTICTSAELNDMPLPVPSGTIFLDLRFNRLRRIRRHTFIGGNLHNVTIILLQNNEIETLEARAFWGLNRLHYLSLASNKLTSLSAAAFAGVSGDKDACKHTYCAIDLTNNPITSLEANAFAWLRWMAVLLGQTNASLIIKAYAFYGVQDIPKVSVVNVSSLVIQRRAFTNAGKLGVFEVSRAGVSRLQAFTFEGLSGVGSIKFSHCNLSVDQFAFAAVHFASEKHGPEGSIHIRYSTLWLLPPKLFTYSNVATIVFENNDIMTLSNHTFSAITHLRTLILKDNGMSVIPPYAMSHLHNVNNISIVGNKLTNIDTFAFKDTKNVEYLDIGGSPHTDLTIGSNAFSHVSNIGHFKLHDVGSLQIKPHAFQDLYKVNVMEISRLHLPVIPKYSFHGLSAVNRLYLVDCNITNISPDAFDHQYIHGEIKNFDISAGNSLKCDCNIKALERTFKMAFKRYKLSCSNGSNLLVGDFVSLPFPACMNYGTRATSTARTTAIFALFILSVT